MVGLRRLFGTLPVVRSASDTWQRTRRWRKKPWSASAAPPARRRLLNLTVLVTMSQFTGLGGFFLGSACRLEQCFKLISLQSLSLRQWRGAMSGLAGSAGSRRGINRDAGTRCDNSGTPWWLDDTCGSV